ncbi:ArnT family glycosyltransferase [Acidicapsa acidisoli]|uniref:ArnT family glycosyltransferase n=1 Tax=Acidicapsa acidisoli TaxID=1615681 RepID=UPI0021DF521E|nr:glycosyltransferase family 39 protein [Acidicapsa acidisoli]
MKNRLHSLQRRINLELNSELDKATLAPLVVAAALRLGLMFAAFLLTGTSVMTQGDTPSYLEPGRNLILHGAFTTSGLPETDRTPGFPLFALLTGTLFGNVLLTLVAQILVSLASLLLVRKIAERIFPHRNAGTKAAWLYACEPLSIASTIRVMPETLFVFLVLVVIERLTAWQKSGKVAPLALAGVFLAAATFVRPVSYYLVIALAIGIALTAGKQRDLWWKAPAVLLVSSLPWLAAWQIRNSIETGYSGFSSIVEQNLYFFQSAEVTAELEHTTLGAEQDKLGYPDESAYITMHPEQRQWSQAQRLHFMREQAISVLAQHPVLYLKTHIAGVGLVAFTPGAAELLQLLGAYPSPCSMPRRIVNEGVMASALRIYSTHPGVTIAMVLLEGFLLLIYCLAMYGFASADRTTPAALTVVGIALYFLLISGGAQAVGRYRAPIMPLLCVFAAEGTVHLWNRKARGHSSPTLEIHSMS